MNSDSVGVVVIGRNEGERLVRCLSSIKVDAKHVIYVDSGSTDGSVAAAAAAGGGNCQARSHPAVYCGTRSQRRICGFTVLAKFAVFYGVLKYWLQRLTNRSIRLIEYK